MLDSGFAHLFGARQLAEQMLQRGRPLRDWGAWVEGVTQMAWRDVQRQHNPWWARRFPPQTGQRRR